MNSSEWEGVPFPEGAACVRVVMSREALLLAAAARPEPPAEALSVVACRALDAELVLRGTTARVVAWAELCESASDAQDVVTLIGHTGPGAKYVTGAAGLMPAPVPRGQ